MKKFLMLIFSAVLLFCFSTVDVSADYTDWKDPAYDFKSVKTVYLASLDTSELEISSFGTEQKLKSWLQKKGKGIKGVNVVEEEMTRPRALLPGESPAPKAEETNAATIIPEAALSAGADLYILPRLNAYQVDSYLVPPHTEWYFDQVPDYWVDRHGNVHTFYRTISYPEYIPAHYVPNAGVSVTFEWYDTKTGNLVATATDERLRGAENDPYQVYKRIVDRFVKRAGEMVGK